MALAKPPTPISTIVQRIRNRFPAAAVAIDPPANPSGLWFIDVNHRGHVVALQWQKSRGFGMTTSPAEGGYGERADEVFTDPLAAFKRTSALLLGRAETSPPEPVRLRELRSLRGISQVELAETLEIQQAAISKLEARTDNILVSTLRSVITAMGGELHVTAKFPDGVEKQLLLGDTPGRTKKKSPVTAASASRMSKAPA